ncbi:MAG TPA: 30S ribosomal protein S13 [Candidatus Paceibacterota bacterium]
MRIQGVTIPDGKRLEVALTAVFGVGRSRAKSVCEKLGVDWGKKPKDLSAAEESKVREVIEAFKIEGDLRREIGGNVKRLKDIGSYRGSRHARRLPVRGQRTKTNSRTVRGNVRKTMGSGKRVEEKK